MDQDNNDLEVSSNSKNDEWHEEEPNDNDTLDATPPPSRSSSQKGALAIAAFALLLAVSIFAMALSSSLLQPKKGVASQKNPIIIGKNAHVINKNDDKGDIHNIIVTGHDDQPEEEDETITMELLQSSSSSIDDSHHTDENESHTTINSTSTTATDEKMPLLPEDCDNPNCYKNNSNNNSSSIQDDEQDPISIFEGPISDFITVSNMTRGVSTNDGKSNSNNYNSQCNTPNMGRLIPLQFILDTDNYAWETTWTIVNTATSQTYASGPPPGKNYAKSTRYVGSLCFPPGQYNLVMEDLMGDGLCCDNGNGKVKVLVDGKSVVETGDESFKVERYNFWVTTGEEKSANNVENVPAINNGEECSIVQPIDYNEKFQHGTGYQGFPEYSCYRTVEGTKQTVNDLLQNYPQLTSKVILNYPTVELEQRLYALVITNKQFDPKVSNPSFGDKGKLLVISAIHARELSTAETMTRFAEYLLQNYGVDPDVTWILDYTEIHLILHANPDGRVYLEKGGEQGFWKKNRNNSMNCDHWRYGVDPNRNFPFKWGKCDDSDGSRCSSSGECQSVVYRGSSAKSEQETKAILQYALSRFPRSQRKGNLQRSEEKWNSPFSEDNEGVFLDIHSHGGYVGWPWGFKNQRTPNDDGLGALGRKFASFTGGYNLWAPKSPKRIYGFDGSTIDTMYGWLGVASFFFELGNSFYQPCETFPNVIREVFPALLYAAKVAKKPYIASRGPDILCTTITSTNKNDGKYINARIEVSDNARTSHANDGDSLFSTGRQKVKLVEIFVNCHPYSGSCSPKARKYLSKAGKTTTVSMQFKAPVGKSNNVMYIRATDSDQYTGPVTARSFVS